MIESKEFEQLRQHPDRSLELAHRICDKHKLPIDCTRIEGGSRLLFASVVKIIKVFPPEESSFFQTEELFLQRLYRKLPVPTPYLYAAGHWGPYPYLIMERLAGAPLSLAWQTMAVSERREVVCQLGQAVRALHSLPVSLFETGPFQWDSFIDHQQSDLVANHQSYGLDPRWLAQLPDYMQSLPLPVHDRSQMVPLHTELMLEHLFVKQEDSHWVLSGLIDFEPSMIGYREYEFSAVGLFITPGDPDLFRLFLSSYGYSDAELTDELSGRIMRWMLLHRYSNLRWFLTRIPAHLQFSELRQLEQYWFGLAPTSS